VKLLLGAAEGANAAVSHLTLAPGAEVPAHVHEGSSELLYIESGTVEMSIGGKSFSARAGDAVFIPAGLQHSARVTSRFESVRAVQIYVGPGPEQRFTRGEKHNGP
jgi:putative monooxygenase